MAGEFISEIYNTEGGRDVKSQLRSIETGAVGYNCRATSVPQLLFMRKLLN